jgi:hypothetical protein
MRPASRNKETSVQPGLHPCVRRGQSLAYSPWRTGITAGLRNRPAGTDRFRNRIITTARHNRRRRNLHCRAKLNLPADQQTRLRQSRLRNRYLLVRPLRMSRDRLA